MTFVSSAIASTRGVRVQLFLLTLLTSRHYNTPTLSCDRLNDGAGADADDDDDDMREYPVEITLTPTGYFPRLRPRRVCILNPGCSNRNWPTGLIGNSDWRVTSCTALACSVTIKRSKLLPIHPTRQKRHRNRVFICIQGPKMLARMSTNQ